MKQKTGYPKISYGGEVDGNTTMANECINGLIKSGARFEQLKPGNYVEFKVSDEHEVLPIKLNGNTDNKMFALFYTGDFYKLSIRSQPYMSDNIHMHAVSLCNDKGMRTWFDW